MPTIARLRAMKPATYPDQAIYAEFAACASGLTYQGLDHGTGLAFGVKSRDRQVWFGGGRCSYFPQNHATAATLAADKYLASVVLEHASIPTLGGDYFFLTSRFSARRPPGHERSDAISYFRANGGRAFVKPLLGSRGDFAQIVADEDSLKQYLDAVASHHDAIIMQAVFAGDEYRIFVLDDAVLYAAQKRGPVLTGDGTSTRRELLSRHATSLHGFGISDAGIDNDDADQIIPADEHWPLPGRMNRSAGGQMTFVDPPAATARLAIEAVKALGLRVGGVDLFTDIDGEPGIARVIEINANPSIRFLEDARRDDLILAIWRHTFAATGLLDV